MGTLKNAEQVNGLEKAKKAKKQGRTGRGVDVVARKGKENKGRKVAE